MHMYLTYDMLAIGLVMWKTHKFLKNIYFLLKS